MKKICLIMVFLVVFTGFVFGNDGEQEEVDFLLFQPNSSNTFVNESRARVQLDNIARYLNDKQLDSGQIHVYGYAAHALVEIDLLNLSRERALFVVNELQRRGVSRDLFADPVAHGAVFLWGNNASEENRYLNRRVRILVDGTILTPEIVNIAEPEEEPEVIEQIEETAEYVVLAKKPSFEFPWEWLLLLLLIPLIPLILFLLKNRKKRPKKEPVQKVIKPQPAVYQPVATPEKAPGQVSVFKQTAKTTEIVVNLEEEIRFRAYEHHLSHCNQYINMNEDWYKALPEVCARYEAKGYQTYAEAGSWWAKKVSAVNN